MQIGWILKLRFRLRGRIRRLVADRRGVAAIEFAMLFPLMLMICFGTIQVSSAVAVDRKVTLTARTLSDLISQASTITSTDISNAFATGLAILTPYPIAPLQAKITEIYIAKTSLAVKVVWSASSNATAHSCADTINLPAALLANAGDTYLVMSEVTYNFTPLVGFNISLGFQPPTFALSDQMYTRPRQSKCVLYPPPNASVTVCGLPPTAAPPSSSC
jgi:Flp pilus assembly protein TadG